MSRIVTTTPSCIIAYRISETRAALAESRSARRVRDSVQLAGPPPGELLTLSSECLRTWWAGELDIPGEQGEKGHDGERRQGGPRLAGLAKHEDYRYGDQIRAEADRAGSGTENRQPDGEQEERGIVAVDVGDGQQS